MSQINSSLELCREAPGAGQLLLAGICALLLWGMQGCAPMEAKPEPEPVVMPKRTVADDVRQLLADAEKALAADRLTAPSHDNAFDRFQAVLMLKPGNAQARSGLQQILLRYLALAKSAIASSEYGKAKALIERARMVDKSNPKIVVLTREMELQQRSLSQTSPEVATKTNEFILPPDLLDKRDTQIVAQLKEIARQARRTGESLLIVARGDAEGRWIYRQMKQAVPGFRLRGDITLGREAKVLLLPPID